jgi:peptide/nickel transport system substrate-binding protein
MNNRLLPVVPCLLAFAGFASGCGSGSSNVSSSTSSGAGGSPAQTTADGGDHRGGTLTMLWNAGGSSIDTAIAYDKNWQVLRMTNDGLLAWKQVSGPPGNDLVPDLATAVPKPSADGKTYAFTLRKGIKFSDGKVVKPSDMTYTLERQFKAAGPAGGFYSGLVGAAACAKKPKSCDLSKGVVADDAAGTVTFKLTAPDPDFLQKLALPFAYVVPTGTKNKDIGTDPLPATGPYVIQSYKPDNEMVFVRNPNFKEWSAEAQPAGNPDRIVMRIGLSLEDATTQIANGQADWMYETPPADRLGEISTKYPEQIHVNGVPQAYHMVLNTLVPPFDNPKVRQALNFAADRNALVKIFGGPAVARPTCQILPPGFPGYQPYCPYTKSPGAKWTAPDLAKAKQLVEESGTKGQKVTIIDTNDDTAKAIDAYWVSVLRQLGYKTGLKTLNTNIQYTYVQDSRNKAQMSYSYWFPDYPAASNFLNIAVGCKGFTKASTSSPNLAHFCDQALEAKTNQALKLGQTDPTTANALWAQIDKQTTDAAPWVAMFVGNRLDFVSKRLGGYAFNPSVAGGMMIQKAWVK